MKRGLQVENQRKLFPVRTEETKLIKNLLYGFGFVFFSILSRFCHCMWLFTLPRYFLVLLCFHQSYIHLLYFYASCFEQKQ